MKLKLNEIKYEVYNVEEFNEKWRADPEEEFDTIKEAREYIKEETMGGKFVIVKITKTREKIADVKEDVVPCYGGWHKGHSVSQEDLKNEVKNPFCTRCGYKLRRVVRDWGNVGYVTVKPLQRKGDSRND